MLRVLTVCILFTQKCCVEYSYSNFRCFCFFFNASNASNSCKCMCHLHTPESTTFSSCAYHVVDVILYVDVKKRGNYFFIIIFFGSELQYCSWEPVVFIFMFDYFGAHTHTRIMSPAASIVDNVGNHANVCLCSSMLS